ncbi:MAG: sialate O-acetylesterase [Candidatus Onthomonas sp.]
MRANRQNRPLPGRLLALLLTAAMVVSLTLESSALTLEQPDLETPDQQEERLTEEPVRENTDNAAEDEASEIVAEPENQEIPETLEEESDTPSFLETKSEQGQEEVPAQECSEAALPEENADEAYTLSVSAVEQLTLQYDDRYDFTNLIEGYVVYSIQTEQVSSNQVSGGSKTSQLDTDVLRLEEDSQTEVVASGVGSANVLLVPEEQMERQSAIQVSVTVKPARLTMIFLAGQSNAEGCCSASAGYKRSDSVVCPEGQVYSTYAPKSESHGWTIGHISKDAFTTDPQAIVAGSLTSTESRNGQELNYPLYALTEQGEGKTGPDSGIAYEWNRLTGDKVWIVNAASSESGVSLWKQGGSCYTRALNIYKAAVKTMEAEISAGHYTKGNRLLFWMQGEADRNYTASEYLNGFQSMHKGFANALDIQYFGLITARSSQGSYTNAEDIYMTGPRIAQYYMGNSGDTEYSDVYVVSNANEQWVSDGGVRSYFRSAYPGGSLTYPLRANSSLSGLPTTVEEVHSDAHYSQVGHNENGLTAARTMYDIVKGKGLEADVSVSWRNTQGKVIDRDLSLKRGASTIVVPVVEPLYCAKQVSYQVSSPVLSYDAASGKLTGNTTGTAALQACSPSGTQVSSLGIMVANLPAPNLQSISNQTSGVRIAWSKVSNANGYRIYRKTEGEGWKQIGTTSGTNYTDTTATSGTGYTYTVRAYQGSNLSAYDTKGLSITYLSSTTAKLANTASGVQVTWQKISKADGYYVYRRSAGGSWSKIGTISNADTLTYTDTGAASGISYEYAVAGRLKNVQSGYTAVSWVWLSTPVLAGAQNVETGIRISWKKVSGAESYAVYRKSSGSGWSRIDTLSGGTTVNYTDTAVSDGTSYTYTVRAIQGKYGSYYDVAGITALCVQTPVITAVKNSEQGVRITWEKVSNAQGYTVYRKEGSSSWTKLDTVTGTGYTDTSALKSGTTYFYTLRAQVGKTISGYRSEGYSILYLSTPQITKAVNTTDGIQLTWNQVSGAENYVVYRKNGSGWTRLGATSGTSYTDAGSLKSGTEYYYTLRAEKGKATSGYRNDGYGVLCLSAPKISKISNSTQGIQVTWNQVSGAAGYQVYRKSGSSGWTLLDTVTETSYLDAAASGGVTYTYTIRAANRGVLSGYDRTGQTLCRLTTPVLTQAQAVSGGIAVHWKAVTGAEHYAVYRKSGGSSWTRVANVTGTTYTDKNVTSGTTYTYTVRASQGSMNSDFDRTGISATAK